MAKKKEVKPSVQYEFAVAVVITNYKNKETGVVGNGLVIDKFSARNKEEATGKAMLKWTEQFGGPGFLSAPVTLLI